MTKKPYGTYIAVDVETTGLSAGIDEIIEIGAVRVVNGELGDRYQSLICPERLLPDRITEITGITQEMLKTERPLKDVLPEFLAFAGELPLLGHNLPFDYSFLKAAGRKQGVAFERKGIDTLRLAKILLPSLEKKTLAALAGFYGVHQEREHRAREDAISCAKIYLCMQKEFGDSPDRQELFLPQPLKATIKKSGPATEKQKKYLLDLLKCHRIEEVLPENLTKSQASALIDYLRSSRTAEVMDFLKKD